MIAKIIILAIACVILTIGTCILNKKYIQIFQQNGYEIRPTIEYFRANSHELFTYNIFIVGGMLWLITYVICYIVSPFNLYIEYLGLIMILLSPFILRDRRGSVVPLKYTKRVKRIFATFCLIYLIITAATAYLGFLMPEMSYSALGLCLAFDPLILLLTCLILSPIEEAIKRGYIKRAKKRFSQIRGNMIVIAITGSYGKTTTRNILYNLLKEKYRVYTPIENYNTPMGLCLAINKMDSDYDIAIFEYGADHIGDIDVLCDMIQPDISIITKIGSQHLSTFGSIDAIVEEKSKILSYAKTSCVFDQDSPYRDKLFDASAGKERLLIGSDIKCRDITIDRCGMTLVLHTDRRDYVLRSKLLGSHNATNIMLAIIVARKLKLSMATIAKSLSSISAYPHRLEPKILSGGAMLIDDSYNINIEGALSSLDVLDAFEGRKKVLITSGVIENADVDNVRLADKIDSVCDAVIILGYRNRHILSSNIKHTVKYYYERFSDINLSVFDNSYVILLHSDFPDKYEE